MDVTIHTSVDEIPAWDDVAGPAGFYSSAGWLRLVHQAGTRYVAVSQAGTVLGVLPCFLAERHGVLPAFSDPAHLLPGGEPDPRVPADVLYPVLFCGAVRGYSNRLLVRGGLDEVTRAAVLRQLVAAVRELGRRDAARLIAFGYLPVADATELAGTDDRLRAIFAESECFAGPLVSFDDYLAGMRTHRRVDTRRQLRRFAECGLRLDLRRLPEVMAPLGELIAAHERRHGVPCTAQEVVDDFELRIRLGLEDSIRVFCAWKGEALVGATLVFIHGRTYYAREFGSDYELGREAGVYFICTFYEPMRVGFEHGMTEVHFGPSTLDAKVARGSRLRPLLFVLDPIAPWAPEVSELLVESARARLAGEAQLLRKFHDDARIREELQIEAIEALLGRSSAAACEA